MLYKELIVAAVAVTTYAIAEELLTARPLRKKVQKQAEMFSFGFDILHASNVQKDAQMKYLISKLQEEGIELDEFDLIALHNAIPQE